MNNLNRLKTKNPVVHCPTGFNMPVFFYGLAITDKYVLLPVRAINPLDDKRNQSVQQFLHKNGCCQGHKMTAQHDTTRFRPDHQF